MSDDSKIALWIVAAFAVFFIFALGSSSSEQAPTDSRSDYTTEVTTEEENEPESLEFMGYECTYDCSGHEAGYDWAYDNDVCDVHFDGGNSESFAKGVRAYAEENC